MKEFIGAVAALAALVVIIDPSAAQVDRRFKTGYKNNVVPVPTPWATRLRNAGLCIAIAAGCFGGASTIALAAGGASGVIVALLTWVLYPHFWSRYQRNGTSNAAFLAARLCMTVAVATGVGFFVHDRARSIVGLGSEIDERASPRPVLGTAGSDREGPSALPETQSSLAPATSAMGGPDAQGLPSSGGTMPGTTAAAPSASALVEAVPAVGAVPVRNPISDSGGQGALQQGAVAPSPTTVQIIREVSPASANFVPLPSTATPVRRVGPMGDGP